MSAWIKAILRPVYRGFVQSAPVQALLKRELAALGASAWTAPIIDEFINGSCGAEYGITAAEKRVWVARFEENTRAIQSGTAPIVHLLLAREILSLPPQLKGDIVECGVWKGASSASLSIVCKRVGRRLKVCDSFEGLPDDQLQRHTGLHTRVYGYYKEGMFRGGLDEVRHNIRQHGVLDACDFLPGFFNESLAALTDPVAFAFLDVDLESSTRDCLKALWPLLADQSAIYSDDAGDLDVIRVYFDEPWWRENLHCPAPGFVGSGCGLPLSPTYSSLGYTRKQAAFDPAHWKTAPFLHYPETPKD